MQHEVKSLRIYKIFKSNRIKQQQFCVNFQKKKQNKRIDYKLKVKKSKSTTNTGNKKVQKQIQKIGKEMDNNQKITPEYVRSLKQPTTQFVCPLSANHYNIQFLDFKIRDVETSKTFFQISREQADEEDLKAMEQQELSPEEEIEMRTVRYHFGQHFFDIKTIGTSLTFSVGSKPVKNFLMIERHYFREKLIQSYEFKFPFCIPNTTNNWESIYDVPSLTEKEKEDMIMNPWETKSDSFYFVGDEIIMHNKAEYNYAPHDSDDEDGQNDDDE